MSYKGTKKHPVSSQSTLSAEAKCFEPYNGASVPSSTGGGQDAGSLTRCQVHMPGYMTSCYPFVQNDQSQPASPRTSLGGSSWRIPGQPPGHIAAALRMPEPRKVSDAWPPTGLKTVPHNFNGLRQTRLTEYMPRQTHQAQGHVPGAPLAHIPSQFLGVPSFPCSTGPLHSTRIPIPQGTQLHGYHPLCHPFSQVLTSPGGGWGVYHSTELAGRYSQGFHSPGHLVRSGNPSSLEARDGYDTEWAMSIEKKMKKKDCSNMVSIGIQNESGVFCTSNPKKKGRSKTIILMDAAIQTDFSDDFANLTLAEKPNSLYENSRRWRDRYQEHSCTSTDSEEADSDSGYSSPQHRKNQTSNSTQPQGSLPFLPRHYLPSDTLAIMHKQGSAANYHTCTYLASPGKGGDLHTSCHNFPNQNTTYTVAPYLQGYAAALSGKPHLSSVHHLNSSGGPLCMSGNFPSTFESATCKTEPDEDEGELVGKKKQRRRRRRRRTHGGDDTGALSDEPLELLRGHSNSNVSRTSTELLSVATSELQFDDLEFPELMSASSALHGTTPPHPSAGLSYSDILKGQLASPLSQESVSMSSLEHDRMRYLSSPPLDRTPSLGKESKNARKRRKRRELADLAAENELAEITLEQQVLKELSAKPPSSGKKSKQPINFNFAEILDSLEKEHQKQAQHGSLQTFNVTKKDQSKEKVVSNTLDANAPTKRGKEREVPKAKKPSPLKKVILKEREEKKRLRTLDDGIACDVDTVNTEEIVDAEDKNTELETTSNQIEAMFIEESHHPESVNLECDMVQDGKGPSLTNIPDVKQNSTSPHQGSLTVEDASDEGSDTDSIVSSRSSSPHLARRISRGDSDLSQEGESSKTSSQDYGGSTPLSADMSPISQTSPISMSPLSPGGSPLNSGINSPVATNNPFTERKPQVVMQIHSRRFREYCTQILDKDIDACCTNLLQDLVRYQDRLYHKDPTKAKSRRRIVLGLREVTKHLKLRKIKCVIISPNLERIQSKGGLDDALNTILQMSSEQQVPSVFALGRRALGRACAKLVPVSVVGIFNYEGAEETFRSLMDLTEKARKAYNEMVSMLEKEAQELQSSTPSSGSTPNTSATGIFPQLFAHMGHSRTPSACSAISFTSSILSEPISENYPHSEPETDSRGYEIIRESHQSVVETKQQEAVALLGSVESLKVKEDEDEDCLDSPNSSSVGHGCTVIVEALHEIDERYEADDEGQEADTEDLTEHSVRSDSQTPVPLTNPASEEVLQAEQVDVDEDQQDADTVCELPHIDSIHSSVVDLSVEVLSQHSSKTVDLNTEILPSHSHKAVGESALGTESTELPCASTAERAWSAELMENKDVGAAVASGIHTINKAARIESWVAASQQQLEKFTVQADKSDLDMCKKS